MEIATVLLMVAIAVIDLVLTKTNLVKSDSLLEVVIESVKGVLEFLLGKKEK